MPPLPSRRIHARYPCKLKIRVFIPRGKAGFDGEMLNVGMGGAFLRIGGSVDGASLQLDVESGRERLSLKARVVRNAGKDAKEPKFNFYGIQFSFTPETENHIRLLVDRVRSGASPGLSMPVRDYWNL